MKYSLATTVQIVHESGEKNISETTGKPFLRRLLTDVMGRYKRRHDTAKLLAYAAGA